MRKSILSRSVVAVATLAVASAALTAAPATAATANGITRDQVVAAITAARTQTDDNELPPALTALISTNCAVVSDETVEGIITEPTEAGDDADGVLVYGYIQGPDDARQCDFGAIVAADPSFVLNGTATVTSDFGGGDVRTAPVQLTGDVAVTPPVLYPAEGDSPVSTFTATGSSTRTTTTNVTVKQATPKTTAERRAARKAYDKRIKSVKKAYKRALKNAGDSTKKKRAAKAAYKARRASALAVYRRAVADGFVTVTQPVSSTEARPFGLTATFGESAPIDRTS